MIDILFQNDALLVIDKPAGLASQPGEGVVGSVVSVLEKELGCRVFPIHRLDKETAGCMMLAKSSEAASHWSRVLSERQAHKRYLAICIGSPEKERGVYRDALAVAGRIQEAETSYKVVIHFSPLPGVNVDSAAEKSELIKGKNALDRSALIKRGGNSELSPAFSLVEFRLGTGRTHQIRRHCAMHGHPIIGDDRYGDFALNRRLKKEVGARRLFLWAWALELPGLGRITAASPKHFIDFLSRWPEMPSLESIIPKLSEDELIQTRANNDRLKSGPSKIF